MLEEPLRYVGFGDVVVPKPEMADYPTILDLPAPHLRDLTSTVG
jgi:hypothetical protein